jgi:hypothetical protein
LLLMMQDAIDRGVELTMKEWVKQMSGRSGVLRRTGTGKEYRGGLKGKGSLRRRSSPGEPPAVDTGALARSVTDREPSRVKTLTVIKRGIIGIKDYGFMLDAGTKDKKTNKQRIAPRPWIEPSKALLRAKVGEKYDRYILGELNRAMIRFLKQTR